MPGKNHVNPIQRPFGTSLYRKQVDKALEEALFSAYQELVRGFSAMTLDQLEAEQKRLEERTDLDHDQREMEKNAIDHARRIINRRMIASEGPSRG